MFNCSFSIAEDTDVDRKFSVNSYGLITTAKRLDRETEREHRIHVLATDEGINCCHEICSIEVVVCTVIFRRT